MRKYLISFLLVLLPESVLGQARRQPIKRFEFSYQYYRIERATPLQQVDFLSRSGGYLDFTSMDRLSSSWDWYYSLGLGYNFFEATESQRLKEDFYIPYHLDLGIKLRFGRIRTLRWILGISGRSEVFATINGANEYSLEQTYSGHLKSGFSINFISLTGANAQLEGLFSFPLTPVSFKAEPVRFLAIVDGNIRVKFHHRSSWGIAGKVRFEDYETVNQAISYFNTRIILGIFFDI